MADRSVVVRLRAEVAGFQASMRSAQMQVADFGKNVETASRRNAAGMQAMSHGMLAVGVAATAGVGVAVKKFADFDAQMSNVQAATHETSQNMNALREAALRAGADTVFSATEAAQGIEELAKAGVGTRDVLAGGLQGALDLAAAGQIEVADAAETAATAMTQFRLSGAQVPHIADLLAAAAGKAQGGVDDMAMALKQSGLVAAQMGLSIEETTGTLAAFASAGLIGSDAGTSFRTMLLRLANPTNEVKELLQEYNITLYDSQGEFVGVAAVAEQLRTKLGGLSEEQRNAALATMFGSDAIRGANVLYEQGADGIQQWIQQVNDQGYAAETAGIKMNNLKGDLEELRGSLETLLIGMGEGAGGPLRSLVQWLTQLTNMFSDLPSGVKQSLLVLGGLIGVVGTLGGAFMVVVPKIAATKAAMADLHLSMTRVRGSALAAGKALGAFAAFAAAAQGIEKIGDSGQYASVGVDAMTRSLLASARAGEAQGQIASLMRENFNGLGSLVEQVFNPSVEAQINHVADAVSNAILGLVGAHHGTDLEAAAARFRDIDTALAGLVSSGNAQAAGQAFRILADEAKRQGVSLDELRGMLPQYTEAAAAAAESQQGLSNQFYESADAAGAAEQSVQELEDAIKGLTSPTLDLRGATREWQQAIDDAAASARKNGHALDVSTDAGRANQAALDAAAVAANEMTVAMAKNGASNRQMAGHVRSAQKTVENLAVSMGMSRARARQLAEQLVQMPRQVRTNVTVNTGAAMDRIAALRGQLAALRSDLAAIGATQAQVSAATKMTIADSRGRADGGLITQGTGPRADDVPIWVSRGEYVVNATATRRFLPLLEALNAGRYAAGGKVGGKIAGGDGASADYSLIALFGREAGRDLAQTLRDAIRDGQSTMRDVADDIKRTAKDVASEARDELKRLVEEQARYAKDLADSFTRGASLTQLAGSVQAQQGFEYLEAGPGGQLVNMTDQFTTAARGRAMVEGIRAQAQRTAQFASTIRKLAAGGLRPDLVRQLLDAGPEGLDAAVALAGMGPEGISDLNAAQAQLVSASGALGAWGGRYVYGQQVSAARSAAMNADLVAAGVARAVGPLLAEQKKGVGEAKLTNQQLSRLSQQIAASVTQALRSAAAGAQLSARNGGR